MPAHQASASSACLRNAVYAFSGTSVKTYIIAGGGLYNTRLDLDNAKSENHLGLNAGAGMTFGFRSDRKLHRSAIPFHISPASPGRRTALRSDHIRIHVLQRKKKARNRAPFAQRSLSSRWREVPTRFRARFLRLAKRFTRCTKLRSDRSRTRAAGNIAARNRLAPAPANPMHRHQTVGARP